MASPADLGEMRFKIVVDKSDVDRELESTKKAVKATAKEAEGGLTQMGKAVEKSTSGIRKFTGSITALAGVVTGWISVIGLAITALTALAQTLTNSEAKAKAYKEELEAVKTVQDRVFARDSEAIKAAGLLEEQIRKNTERAAELRKEIERLEGIVKVFRGLRDMPSTRYGERIEAMKKELATLDAILARDQDRVQAQRQLNELQRQSIDLSEAFARMDKEANRRLEERLQMEERLRSLQRRQRFGTSNQALFFGSRATGTGSSNGTPSRQGGIWERVGSG